VTDLLSGPAPPERPPIDPRIARRWIDVRRQEGRRRLHVLVVLGVLTAVVAAAIGSLYTPILHVRHLRVTVDGPLSAASVGRLSSVDSRTLMIHVHPSGIAARLGADPWLGQVRVNRRWPGTVTISVEVRHAVAAVAVTRPGGGWAEVDPTGRVLAYLSSPPLGMPILQGVPRVPAAGAWISGSSGPAAAPNATPPGLVDMAAASDGSDVPAGPAAALAVLAGLPATLRADVLSVDAAPGPGLSLSISPPRLASGAVTVARGDGSQLQSKVTALVTLLATADLSGVTALDLSVPSRPASTLAASGGRG
jgi:cell division protein FtsQ